MQTTVLYLRVVGALSLFVIAADHLYEYYADHYSAIPTIGPLFLLNGVGATALGLILLAPIGRLLPRRVVGWMLGVAGAAGAALAASSLVGLFVSETEPLFGFMEIGYRAVIVVAIASEAIAVVALALLLLLTWRGGRGPSALSPAV
jgi:hypothetical protein